MTRTLHHLADRLTHAVALAGMGLLSVAILVTVADIILRATLNEAILGMVDLTQLSVMAAAFWAIPFAFSRGGHVSVEVGADRMPPRLRHGLDGLAALLGAVFMGLIAWYGWDSAALAADYGDVSQNLALPMVAYWTFLLSGAALSVLAVLMVALRHFAAVVTGRDPVVEPEPLEDAP